MNHHVVRVSRAALAALAACSIGAAAAEPALPQSAVQWRQAAVDDIEEAVRLTRDNHPGTHDRANPAFPARLDAARRDALALAARVDGPAAYTAALMRFNATLGDGHAGIVPQLGPAAQPSARWPGFVTAWRQGGLFVQASGGDAPPVGAQVLDCDGKPVAQLIERNVFAFDGRSDEPGRWWSRARTLFLDTGNPFIALPGRCRFAVDGKTVERDLAWRAVDAQATGWLKDGYNGPVLEVGLSEPRKGLFWAAMPTFDPDPAQREAYRAMTAQVAGQRQRFLDADAVVIDLRRNQGGSSAWSRMFAAALWGEGRVERRLNARSAKTETWWRASQGNADYMAEVLDEFTRENRVESLAWAKRNSAGLQAALARGDTYYVEKDDAPAGAVGAAADDLPDDPPPFTRPVYVIVPGQCASACLDALDAFTQFPNTILIGAPSSADSTYMEVRLQKLRSGLASVVIPNKVYVNRARANGQVYLPAIYVNDVDWSFDTFRQVVEKDLARRRR
ncbi:S41 family peptidase [uncultured Massilia sp.]|uniref:S41 family peptidase n=1 Tax=uncultured Massilia sp. TaxID=169973 RepID=UPI0025FB8133|nr:S41 family peptidase [uncultured Massilia sp.]